MTMHGSDKRVPSHFVENRSVIFRWKMGPREKKFTRIFFRTPPPPPGVAPEKKKANALVGFFFITTTLAG